MRILHLLAFLRAEYGGPVRAVLDLCGALAAKGHDVTLCAWDTADAPPEWDGVEGRPKVERIHAPAPTGIFTKAGRQAILHLIEAHDVLHLHGVWNPWNWQLGAIARSADRPYIVSVRGMLDDWCMAQKAIKKRLFLALAVRRWLESAAYVHLTARAEFDQARKHFPRGRGIIIPNLLDLAPFERLPGPEVARARFQALASNRPSLLFLSRLHVKKGLESLLRAAAVLRGRGADVNILIAGTGEPAYVDSVKRLAGALGLHDRAHFLGLVVGDEKLSLYQACDLFVLPTSQENFGFVFVESLACGTPVVTTRGVDIWPELEACGGAVICEGDAEGVAGALAGLLARRADLPAMGRRGRAWVFDALHPDKVIAQFEGMYAQALSRSG